MQRPRRASADRRTLDLSGDWLPPLYRLGSMGSVPRRPGLPTLATYRALRVLSAIRGDLLARSHGENLGFRFLEGARDGKPDDV
jgi:hypothetical protein